MHFADHGLEMFVNQETWQELGHEPAFQISHLVLELQTLLFFVIPGCFQSCAGSFREVIQAPSFYDLIFSCGTTARLTASNCGEKKEKDQDDYSRIE